MFSSRLPLLNIITIINDFVSKALKLFRLILKEEKAIYCIIKSHSHFIAQNSMIKLPTSYIYYLFSIAPYFATTSNSDCSSTIIYFVFFIVMYRCDIAII